MRSSGMALRRTLPGKIVDKTLINAVLGAAIKTVRGNHTACAFASTFVIQIRQIEAQIEPRYRTDCLEPIDLFLLR
jgi:hypothetical protein